MSSRKKVGVRIGVGFDIMPSVEIMTNAQLGEMFLAILNYGKYGIEPEFSDKGLYFAWVFIKQSIRDVYSDGNQEERKTVRYTKWRKFIYERDNYTCQKCGQHGGNLNAHHIKPWSQYPDFRFFIDNGITLCKNCHKLIHKERSK